MDGHRRPIPSPLSFISIPFLGVWAGLVVFGLEVRKRPPILQHLRHSRLRLARRVRCIQQRPDSLFNTVIQGGNRLDPKKERELYGIDLG